MSAPINNTFLFIIENDIDKLSAVNVFPSPFMVEVIIIVCPAFSFNNGKI